MARRCIKYVTGLDVCNLQALGSVVCKDKVTLMVTFVAVVIWKLCICLTLTVPVTTSDALQYFETG